MTTAPSDKKPGTCPTCGAENAPGSRFCERCGTRLPPSSREAAGPTPSTPTDATLTFERPLVGVPREELAPASTGADQPTIKDAEAAAQTSAEEPAERSALNDAATVNFDLPTMPAPLSTEERSAQTLTFDLPEVSAAQEAAQAPTPEPPPPAEEPTQVSTTPVHEEQPAAPETTAAEKRSWDYQPWTPQSPAEQAAPTPAAESGGTRPAIAMPPTTSSTTPPPPVDPMPVAPPAMAAERPETARHEPSAAAQYGVGAQSSPAEQTVYTYPTPNQPPQSVGQLPPAAGAGAPPPYGYPPQGGTVGWSPASGSAYPAPATGNSNRTLWIVLGVVGGLLILCAMICVLIFLVGVASASSAGAVATGVATTTRP